MDAAYTLLPAPCPPSRHASEGVTVSVHSSPPSSEQSAATPGVAYRRSPDSRDDPQRTGEEELLQLTEPNLVASSEPAGIRPLRSVVVADPVADAHPALIPDLPPRPVYDPFSARRRRAPEWLVSYTVALLITDAVAAGV